MKEHVTMVSHAVSEPFPIMAQRALNRLTSQMRQTPLQDEKQGVRKCLGF